MKVVAYCCTANWYEHLKVAVNSLLINNPGIDKVVCFIEDDELPWHYDKVEAINLNKLERYIREGSPNYNSLFTYMTLMRLCFSKWLPYDKVLQLDVDTLVVDNIEDLWDLDMTDMAIAAVPDVINPLPDTCETYINAGVMLVNLEYLRKTEIDEAMINEINTVKHLWPDQDVVNVFCQGHTLLLGYEFNDLIPKRRTFKPKILHYAGLKEWWKPDAYDSHYWLKWKNITDESL